MPPSSREKENRLIPAIHLQHLLRASFSGDQLVNRHLASFAVRLELTPAGKRRLHHQMPLFYLLVHGELLERLELICVHRGEQIVPVGLDPPWKADYLANAKAVRAGD